MPMLLSLHLFLKCPALPRYFPLLRHGAVYWVYCPFDRKLTKDIGASLLTQNNSTHSVSIMDCEDRRIHAMIEHPRKQFPLRNDTYQLASWRFGWLWRGKSIQQPLK
ncbi:predicted protein [Sclerotinia sclerotiorum 1980 UF-70]|uniref:Uncharacterized protein n=1 Tax=Sclerotinia sclerotiorum (strain ATCC 18683 / 1980 / Ss-1) TaxID=665079 RepID=A7F160_SCLS1|nr:predicted protein [Sclerotinia sclerotiorum 1980 UF-70]EDN95452.1 predicted protein [Sclerotinia sclerotiorum 1980 UF-70]